MRIYLQKPATADNPAKFYQLLLQQDLLAGWVVVTESGMQGSAGRVKRELFETRQEAERSVIVMRDAQLERGYHVVFVQGEYL